MTSKTNGTNILKDPAARMAVLTVSIAASMVFITLFFLVRAVWLRLTKRGHDSPSESTSAAVKANQALCGEEPLSERSPLLTDPYTVAVVPNDGQEGSDKDENSSCGARFEVPRQSTPPRRSSTASTTQCTPASPQAKPPHEQHQQDTLQQQQQQQAKMTTRRNSVGGETPTPGMRHPSYGSVGHPQGSAASAKAARGSASSTFLSALFPSITRSPSRASVTLAPLPPETPRRLPVPQLPPVALEEVPKLEERSREHLVTLEAVGRTRIELHTLQISTAQARQRNHSLRKELADLTAYRDHWEEDVLPTLFYDLQTAAEELADAESQMLTSVDRRQSVLKVVAAESRAQESELLSRLSALVSQAQGSGGRVSRRPSAAPSVPTTPRVTNTSTPPI